MSTTLSKVVVFGATGKTGLCSIDRALKKGKIYPLKLRLCNDKNLNICLGAQVTALVRDASRLPSELVSQITAIKGDSTVKDDVDKAISGQDGVIVALGTGHDLSKLLTLLLLHNAKSFKLCNFNFMNLYSGYTTVMSSSLKLILDSMLEHGVKNISVCLSCNSFNYQMDYYIKLFQICIF